MAPVKGYLFNAVSVVIGSGLGLLIGGNLRERVKDDIFNVLGLATAFVGIKMALNASDVIPVVFALVLGSLFGGILCLEDRLQGALHKLNDSSFSGRYAIDGFLVASTLFCVGSMTIIGSLKDGLYNDSTLIRTKSVLDGFASFVLASRYGLPVAFSAITVVIVQGGLTLFSNELTFLTTTHMMNNIDGVGGIIVLAIGLNLLKLKTIRTLDMLPGIVLIILYGLAIV